MLETKRKLIEEIKSNNPNKPLIFVHTPKCGGTYVGKILKDLGIRNMHHHLAKKEKGIHFIVIREPVNRFESLLNYRLDPKSPMDWPRHLKKINTNTSLNEIVTQMSDSEILSFAPYKTLTYWSQDVDILITMNELKEFLQMFGYTYNEANYSPRNVSSKTRGTLNDATKERLYNLYQEDINLYNRWTKVGCGLL